MPIGKNSISRVKNNGYANIANSAPDMQDSKVTKKKTAPVSKKQPTKAKSASQSAKISVKTDASKKKATLKKNYFKIGDKLPTYLL